MQYATVTFKDITDFRTISFQIKSGTDTLSIGNVFVQINGSPATVSESSGTYTYVASSTLVQSKYTVKVTFTETLSSGVTTRTESADLYLFMFDRTQLDVNRVKYLNTTVLNGTASVTEKAEWDTDLKGAVNLSDMDRIRRATEWIGKYYNKDYGALTSSEIGIFLSIKYWNSYLESLKAINTDSSLISNKPAIPALPWTTFAKMNQVEYFLYVIFSTLFSTSYIYCGENNYCNNELI